MSDNNAKRTTITLTMYVTVHDPEAFIAAAAERAKHDGVGDSWNPSSLSECAVMLLDPGISPTGSQIEDTSAEIDGPDPLADDED